MSFFRPNQIRLIQLIRRVEIQFCRETTTLWKTNFNCWKLLCRKAAPKQQQQQQQLPLLSSFVSKRGRITEKNIDTERTIDISAKRPKNQLYLPYTVTVEAA